LCAALVGVLIASGGVRTIDAQAPAADQRQADIAIELSTSDMIRRSAVDVAAGQAVNRAADLGLDALIGRTDQRRARDVFARLGRIWFVNMPVAALAQGAAHDSGHFARLAETGVHEGRRHVDQWPWPVPIVVSVEFVPPPESPEESITHGLAILGGGEQASTLTKQRVTDQIFTRDSAGYFDWMLLAYASLDYPIYAWSDLSGNLESTYRRGPGDFRQYAELMTFLGAHPSAETEAWHADRLRHDAWLNLADYSLWQALARVAQYVATGERRTQNAALSIGGIRFVPAAYATLGSLGPERGIDVRVSSSALLTRVNVRQMSTPADDALWGAGAAIRSRDPRRLLPEGNIDVWQRTGRGPGFRLEAGTTTRRTIHGQPFDASVRIGYKTEGYLMDAPMRATILAAFSVSWRF
jgi:hypothetical protein